MSRTLRLFGIRPENDTKPIEDLYFSDLLHARRERDRISLETAVQHVVCPGPDHKRYKNG